MGAIRTSRAARPALGLAAAALAANAAAASLATGSPARAGLVLLGAGILVLSFARPGLVLCATAFCIVASADLLDLLVRFPRLSAAGLEIQLSDVFLVVLLLAWAGWELQREPGSGPSLRAVVREPAFVPFVPLMALAAFDLARGGYGTLSSARIFAYAVLVPVAVRTIETPRHLRLFGGTLVAAATVSAVVASGLAASGRSVAASDLSTGGARGLSISGSYLVAGALVFLLAGIAATELPPNGVTAVLLLVLAAGVAASGARETWLGLAGAVALLLGSSRTHGMVRIGLAFGLAGLFAVGAYSLVPHPPQLARTLQAMEQRLLSVDPASAASDPSVQVRYEKWRVVWDQLEAHPVLGTGFGYPATYTSNIGGSNFVRSYVDDPENTQLWLWARMGTIGFLAWAAFNLISLGTLIRRFARTRSPSARTAALWGAGTLAVLWSGMTFSPVSAFSSTLLLYWLAIALVPVTHHLTHGDAEAGLADLPPARRWR